MAPALLRNDSYNLEPWTSPSSSRCKATSTPKVSVIDVNTYETEERLTDDIISSLKVSGGCIIRNMYQQSTLDGMEQEIRPYINATGKATSTSFITFENAYLNVYSRQARRLRPLLNKTSHRPPQQIPNLRPLSRWEQNLAHCLRLLPN